MKQQEANLFLEGLNLDTSPIAMSNLQLSYALNATMITKNGNEMVLQNDMGNGRVETAHLPAGYVPVGVKEHGGIVYVASYNPLTNLSLIGSFPSPERNISLEEECGDKDLIFGYFAIDDIIPQLTMKLLLTLDVLRPGDKFSIDMYDYALLSSLIHHIDQGIMTLDVAILNSTGGLVKLDYMQDLELSGVAKYTYEGIDTFIRYAKSKYLEEDIKYNVLKSKIVGELFLQLTLNVPEFIPYEVTAYSYVVENVPMDLRSKNGIKYAGYFDVLLPKYHKTSDNIFINNDLKYISNYKIETSLDVYDVTIDLNTGEDVLEFKATKIKDNNYLYFYAGHAVRVYYTQEDVDNEVIKSLDITPYFDDPIDILESSLNNSGWLPMLKRTISVNPAKIGKGEVYLSEFRYYNNINDGFMTLNYSFESYLRKHEFVKDLSLVLLPYEDILDENYTAKSNTLYTLRPTIDAHVGNQYFIKIPLKSNRKNYFGSFSEAILYEDPSQVKSYYSDYEDEILAHNKSLYKISEGFCSFLPGQSYIGYIEVKTERYTDYTKTGDPEIRLLRSKPLAIFTCTDINDLYFNTKLNTFIRGDISNTAFDDRIIIPSSLHVGFLALKNQSTSLQTISNITHPDDIKILLSYGDMDQTNFDLAALIKVLSIKLYEADYSLTTSPTYNVSDQFPIGIDTDIEFLDNELKGQMFRDKATVNGNALYYDFTDSNGERVIIDTAKLDDKLEVEEKSEVLGEGGSKFAYIYRDAATNKPLLHIKTFDLPAVYYGVALRQDDYYVDDVSMLRAFNDNWEEGPLLGGCVYGDHYRDTAKYPGSYLLTDTSIEEGRHYMAGGWIATEAFVQSDSSKKRWNLLFADGYDPTFWSHNEPEHEYYVCPDYEKCGSYFPGEDYKLALDEDGNYKNPELTAVGTGRLTPKYKKEGKNKWKIAIDQIAPKGYKHWQDTNPIITFWQSSVKNEYAKTFNYRFLDELVNSLIAGKHVNINYYLMRNASKSVDCTDQPYFTNFCVPILKDSSGYHYALNEWGYASLALVDGISWNGIWKETYLDQLYRTFGYCFGRQDHITENIMFKKVPDDDYDTYTNPYTCKINLSLQANIHIKTKHYDNINRAFSVEFLDSSLETVVTVNKIVLDSINNYDHPIVMPEIAISDVQTDKIYTLGDRKEFMLPTLTYNSANFKQLASKFYEFEPGNYTLLRDGNSYHIMYNNDGLDALFNINQQYFKGFYDNKYYSTETKNASSIVYGKTILLELKDNILRYKRDSSTGWYGLILGTNHKLLVGGKSNLGENIQLYKEACNYGLLDDNLNYMKGDDDLGETDADFSNIPNMIYMSNARLLDDFGPDPSKIYLHYIYDYRLPDTIPSIVYNISRATGNNYILANRLAISRRIDLGEDSIYTSDEDIRRPHNPDKSNNFGGHYDHTPSYNRDDLDQYDVNKWEGSSTHKANHY